MIRLLVFFIFVIPYFSSAQSLGGHPSSIKWKQINTPHARIIFPAGLDSQANRIHNMVQLLNATTTSTIGNKNRKWNIILKNQTTISNAYVRLAPVMSELNMTPDQNNFETGSLRWDDNLIIHEDRHMQQLSNFNHGLGKVFSFFLGQDGQLLVVGLTIPDYFLEGDAVWQETLVSEQGRGRLASFFNGFKSLSLGNKKYSWMKLRSGSYKDYTPDHYELGYQLIAYGNAKYGEDFWKKVTADAVRFKSLFYSFNKAIEKYSGKSYKLFRQDALDFFKQQSITQIEKKNDMNFISGIKKNDVVDYLFPCYISDDSILVTKKSYHELNSFYLIVKGKEHKINVKDFVPDDYYSYNHGKIVYAAYRSDPRRANRSYSVIQVVDIKTKKHKQLTAHSKYFSPDINTAGTEIIAVSVNPDGTNFLTRLNANTGAVISVVPNLHNFFFTQTKYLNAGEVVSAVRDAGGKMALVKVNLTSGQTETLTPFSLNVLGYPAIKGDTVYFNAMQEYSDKVFAVSLSSKKITLITNNINGIYYPALNNKAELLVSAFTADGYRLAKINLNNVKQVELSSADFSANPDLYTAAALKKTGANASAKPGNEKHIVTKYKKGFHLFDFHSWRPYVNDPGYGYTLYSYNVLSSFSNSITYSYNRNEGSHTLAFSAVYAGWYPVLSLSTEAGLNRTVDTALGKPFTFNSALAKVAVSVPLSFVGGRTSKFLSIGAGFNAEQLYYRGIGKNVFDNKALQYGNAFLSFSHTARQAKQHVAPCWGQSIYATYRYAFNFIDSRKFTANSTFYFPGFFVNHSLVANIAYQKRDSLPDLFSNTFSYSRGYDALSTRRMYKLGINYQLPVLYPDWGFGNMIFFQRVRANAFYDHTVARARLNGILTDIMNRSTGAELFFDTKVWNALPVSFGVRYSHLLDTNFRDPSLKNRWEFIVPIGLIPHG